MLQALGVSTQPQMENIGGTPFLTFECSTMDTETLRPLSTLSSVYLWARREGEGCFLARPPFLKRGHWTAKPDQTSSTGS